MIASRLYGRNVGRNVVHCNSIGCCWNEASDSNSWSFSKGEHTRVCLAGADVSLALCILLKLRSSSCESAVVHMFDLHPDNLSGSIIV